MSVTVKIFVIGSSQRYGYELRAEIASSEFGPMTISRALNAHNEGHAKTIMRQQLSAFASELAKALDHSDSLE